MGILLKKSEVKASDLTCCEAKCNNHAVAFWPVMDPDIPSHPYCRKCLDAAKINMIIQLNKTQP